MSLGIREVGEQRLEALTNYFTELDGICRQRDQETLVRWRRWADCGSHVKVVFRSDMNRKTIHGLLGAGCCLEKKSKPLWMTLPLSGKHLCGERTSLYVSLAVSSKGQIDSQLVLRWAARYRQKQTVFSRRVKKPRLYTQLRAQNLWMCLIDEQVLLPYLVNTEQF